MVVPVAISILQELEEGKKHIPSINMLRITQLVSGEFAF